MPKSLLYIIITIETIALIGLGGLFLTQPTSVASEIPAPAIELSARTMTVYVKSAGTGERTTDVVGKVYLQDDASGRAEFLFDLGAGCFPTWTLDPLNGYNLLVVDGVDVDGESLEKLMREGQLHYPFTSHSELEITKILGIRAATLMYDDQQLQLSQQCS